MTMGEFDGKRALGEEIQGLNNILTTIASMTQQAEMKATEAAQHYDNMVKLKAFAQQEIARKRKVLQALQEQEAK